MAQLKLQENNDRNVRSTLHPTIYQDILLKWLIITFMNHDSLMAFIKQLHFLCWVQKTATARKAAPWGFSLTVFESLLQQEICTSFFGNHLVKSKEKI